jgi:CBS domain-containing protein
MSRTDAHFDAMLRHLGAAYYESLHGRADGADVSRALGTVEDHLREHPSPQAEARAAARPEGLPASQEHERPARPGAPAPRRHRYARRVRDVMTTDVVTVDRITPYKEITRLLAEHQLSGVPVLSMGRHVVGMVTEADLLAVEEGPARQSRVAIATGRRAWRRGGSHTVDLVAGDLMTSPAITIHPDATIPAAARLMNASRATRLPVVDPDGKLIGIVSRRDLLSVFLRPDEEIAGDAQQVLSEILLTEPGDASVSVRNGILTLTGTLKPAEGQHTDLVPVAVRLLWDIDGVVDVVNHLTKAGPEPKSKPAAQAS